jgi:hypothetical protein
VQRLASSFISTLQKAGHSPFPIPLQTVKKSLDQLYALLKKGKTAKERNHPQLNYTNSYEHYVGSTKVKEIILRGKVACRLHRKSPEENNKYSF